MIFKPEMVELILNGRKTVTRRPVKYNDAGEPLPCRYEVGKTYAIQPGRGKKAVGRLRVRDIRRERLGDVGFVPTAEARREGFKDWGTLASYWTKLYGTYDPDQLVDRIEFERVEQGGEND